MPCLNALTKSCWKPKRRCSKPSRCSSASFRIATGRASTSLVENIQIETYRTMVGLRNIAGISQPDARTIAIQPWDATNVAAQKKRSRNPTSASPRAWTAKSFASFCRNRLKAPARTRRGHRKTSREQQCVVVSSIAWLSYVLLSPPTRKSRPVTPAQGPGRQASELRYHARSAANSANPAIPLKPPSSPQSATSPAWSSNPILHPLKPQALRMQPRQPAPPPCCPTAAPQTPQSIRDAHRASPAHRPVLAAEKQYVIFLPDSSYCLFTRRGFPSFFINHHRHVCALLYRSTASSAWGMDCPMRTVGATMCAPCSSMNSAARSGSMPIMVRNVEPSSVTS